MPTDTLHRTTSETLGKVLGGQWHWNEGHNAYFLDTSPALRGCYSTMLTRDGYAHRIVHEFAGGPQMLTMTPNEAMLAIYHASDMGYGDTKPSLMQVYMDTSHRGWQTEAALIQARSGQRTR